MGAGPLVHEQSMNKEKQVLLIDNQQEFCTLVADILDRSICALTCATDPHEGLRMAMTRNDLDLILLDIEMPELNGLEILQQLKKSHARKIPVIMLTAHAEQEIVSQTLEMGANSYILKPFRVQEFTTHLSETLKQDIFVSSQEPSNPWRADAIDASLNAVPQITHRLLMVDDDARQISLVQDLLEASSCALLSTQDPHQGLLWAEQKKPDLILLDINMPEMGGLEFLYELRRQGSTVPVMILTSDNSLDTLNEAKNYQIEGFILKPFKFHFFVQQLEKALGSKLFAGKI